MKYLLLFSAALASAPPLLHFGLPYTFQQTTDAEFYEVDGVEMQVSLQLQGSVCQVVLAARAGTLPQWTGRRVAADQVDVAGWQFNSSLQALRLPEVNTTRYVAVFLVCTGNVTDALYTLEISVPDTCPQPCRSCKTGTCLCPEGFIGEDCRFRALSADNGDSEDLEVLTGWRLLHSEVSAAGNA